MNFKQYLFLGLLGCIAAIFVVHASSDFIYDQSQVIAAGGDSGHGHGDHAHGDHAHDDHAGGHHGVDGKTLPLFWGLPFAGILLSIALMPLAMTHFWHHNYGKVAAFWAVLFCVPFFISFKSDAIYEFLHIILLDYVPFIILLGTLFTAAGGICLKGSLRGSPIVNTFILALGTSLASFMGTTGAAMLLIRPLIKANKWRKKKVHLVVFFIFLVANIGGSLTPLGDPPLFLGFLKGVSFGWTMNLLPLMTFASVVLLIVFFIFDTIMMKGEGVPPDDGVKEPLKLEGKINFLFLAGIIGAILLSSSLAKEPGFYDMEISKSFDAELAAAVEVKNKASQDLIEYYEEHGSEADPEVLQQKRITAFDATNAANAIRGKQDHDSTAGLHIGGVTVPFSNCLRDGLLIFIFILSMVFTKRQTREDNFFTWEPILEVAKLFSAIFLTIIPVLAILKAGVHGQLADIIWAVLNDDNSPKHAMYFWLTGILSSFLDNAPTYVVFFNTAGGDAVSLMAEHKTLLAISTGAVFMGANTYIGNAPNFMVKAIAEENEIKMPSFFGYMGWSICFLVPLFIVISFIWF